MCLFACTFGSTRSTGECIGNLRPKHPSYRLSPPLSPSLHPPPSSPFPLLPTQPLWFNVLPPLWFSVLQRDSGLCSLGRSVLLVGT